MGTGTNDARENEGRVRDRGSSQLVVCMIWLAVIDLKSMKTTMENSGNGKKLKETVSVETIKWLGTLKFWLQ